MKVFLFSPMLQMYTFMHCSLHSHKNTLYVHQQCPVYPLTSGQTLSACLSGWKLNLMGNKK